MLYKLTSNESNKFMQSSSCGPKFMWSYFSSKNLSYNLRKGPSVITIRKVYSVWNKFCAFQGTLIWKNLSHYVKSSASVFEFKRYFKTLGSINCSRVIAKLTFFNA